MRPIRDTLSIEYQTRQEDKAVKQDDVVVISLTTRKAEMLLGLIQNGLGPALEHLGKDLLADPVWEVIALIEDQIIAHPQIGG